jgi:uncharacterized protein (TIGR04255 family)
MVERFRNAPITEALIDIRADLPPSVSLADLEKLHSQVEDNYPGKQTRTMWEGAIQPGDKREPLKTTRHHIDGYLFKSADGKQVVQFRLDGFSFSRLHPYTEWTEVYAEARRVWDIYRIATKPVGVKRLATRYINSIVIPSKKFDYDHYFTAAPKIPEGLPQLLSHFFTRLVIPFPDQGATAIVIQTPSDKPDPARSTVILDIDVFVEFKEVELAADDPRIDEMFAILRKVKNEIFFSCVTEPTKELFR